MIVWLDAVPRRSFRAKVVNRVGFLEKKDYPIHRAFDHIAFSMFTGDVAVSLEDQNGKVFLDHPCCVLALPGDVRELVPLRPVDEFFFVLGKENLERLFPGGTECLPKVLPLETVPLVQCYVSLMMELLKGAITSSVCEQLDLTAAAVLCATFRRCEDQKQRTPEQILGDAIEHDLRMQYHKDPDWERIAGKYSLSYSSFRRIWRATHRISPHAFIMDIRNREACELLKDRSLPIQKIAELVGYEDTRYFSRFFTRCNGCSPSEYRKRGRL